VPRSKEVEQRLQRVERQLRLYQRISRYMARGIPLNEAMQTIVNDVAEFIHSDSCLLYLQNDGELVLVASRSPNPAAIGEVRLRLDEGLTGWVARERRILAITREAYNDPRFKFFRDLPEDTYEAFLSAPVIARNRVVGVINIQHRQSHVHTGDDIELITTVGEMIGALVAQALADERDLERAAFVDLVLAQKHSAPAS
jgi:signal transduction protein with GAF and PtsI domain